MGAGLPARGLASTGIRAGQKPASHDFCRQRQNAEKSSEECKTHFARHLIPSTSTVSDLSFVDVEWRQHVAFFVVVVTGEFVTLQASLAVVLDAGGCGAAALAVEDLGDARAELWQRDCRGPFFSPVAIL